MANAFRVIPETQPETRGNAEPISGVQRITQAIPPRGITTVANVPRKVTRDSVRDLHVEAVQWACAAKRNGASELAVTALALHYDR